MLPNTPEGLRCTKGGVEVDPGRHWHHPGPEDRPVPAYRASVPGDGQEGLAVQLLLDGTLQAVGMVVARGIPVVGQQCHQQEEHVNQKALGGRDGPGVSQTQPGAPWVQPVTERGFHMLGSKVPTAREAGAENQACGHTWSAKASKLHQGPMRLGSRSREGLGPQNPRPPAEGGGRIDVFKKGGPSWKVLPGPGGQEGRPGASVGPELTRSIPCSLLTFRASSFAKKSAKPWGGRTRGTRSLTGVTAGLSTRVSSSSGCSRLATKEKYSASSRTWARASIRGAHGSQKLAGWPPVPLSP